jgi:hypothetical protein
MSDQGLFPENSPGVAGPEAGTGTAEQQAASPRSIGRSATSTFRPSTPGPRRNWPNFERQQELYDLMISTDDPDTRRQVAERLGYQLEEEPEPEPEYDDPFEKYNERLGRIEQSLTQREQTEQDEAYAAEVRSAVDARLDTLGLDKDDQDWVLAYAINALPVTQEGLPDIEQAHSVFVARETERQRKWAKGKRSAPHIAPNGQAATEVPNLDKRQERVDWMLRRMQENES